MDNGFKPLYVVSSPKKSVVANLKKLLKTADELYLATDEDREGESIAWHLSEVLDPTVPVKRMVFHEITPAAIARAVDEWRDLDRRLVDAQEARRILDRLYGYEVSPVLWRKVMPRLSAGRVQSVATRMVVERERARMRFRSATWWGIDGTFSREAAASGFGAALVALGGTAVATGKDFDELGEQSAKSEVRVLGEDEATSVAEALTGQAFSVKSVTERPFRRSPAAPFMTSTLQQEAGRKLRFSAQRAMQVAQRLYEQGYITYMRTDSTTLSDQALTAARDPGPRALRRRLRARRAPPVRAQGQERAGSARGHPPVGRDVPYAGPGRPATFGRRAAPLRDDLDAHGRLADERRHRDERAGAAGGRRARAAWPRGRRPSSRRAAGSSPSRASSGLCRGARRRPGGRAAPTRGCSRPWPRATGSQGTAFEPGSHTTQPPARYTEASLVKAMEELGVGRPSTYASVIATILDRGYVWKKGTALVPSFTAFAVVGLLERYFADLVDYGFTASMEDDLDEIAAGTGEALPWLTRFYFGSDAPGAMASDGTEVDTLGLKATVAAHLAEIDAREINSIPLGEGTDGEQIVARVGRYGPYLQRGEDRASIPDDLAPDELTIERAEEILAAPSNDRVLGTDPESGLDVQVKAGRFGPYVQMGEVVDGGEKPRTASLFSSMDPATLTFEQALELLRIPRHGGDGPRTRARRSWRTMGASGRTSSAAPTRAASGARSNCSP